MKLLGKRCTVEAGKDINYDRVCSRLYYEEESGLLYWHPKEGNTREIKIFNTRYANKPAGSYDSLGYCRIWIDGHRRLAHKLIWFIAYQDWPSLEIDHIDRNPSNNRLNNLRLATKGQNGRNAKVRSNSESGVKGVFWEKRRKHWVAHITIEGKGKYLGSFKTKEEAAEAFKKKSLEISPDFSRFD